MMRTRAMLALGTCVLGLVGTSDALRAAGEPKKPSPLAADLRRAIEAADVKALRLSLEAGADPNSREMGQGDMTCLMVASTKGNTSLVAVLLDHRADINAKDQVGATALMYAAMLGREEAVRLLIQRGADRKVRNIQDDTAADVARKMGHKQIAAFLESDLSGVSPTQAGRGAVSETPHIEAAPTPKAVQALLDAIRRGERSDRAARRALRSAGGLAGFSDFLALVAEATSFPSEEELARLVTTIEQENAEASAVSELLLLIAERHEKTSAIDITICKSAIESLGLLGPVAKSAVPMLTLISRSGNHITAKSASAAIERISGKERPVPALETSLPASQDRQRTADSTYRTWTARDGRKLDAALLRVDGQTITIRRRSDEKTFSVPLNQFSDADRTWAAGPDGWPTFSGNLAGTNEVRVKNPNGFGVRVGLRSSGKGCDFFVSANGVANAAVPDGKYDIYFVYSSDPTGIYQGDSFSLASNDVEIQIVKVVDGNYGIRKIK